MHALGFGSNQDALAQLLQGYAEPHRHYHNWSHIAACLAHLDATDHLAEHPEEVEAALWFHDAIYNPLSRANEDRCAVMAGTWIDRNDGAPAVRRRVESMIRLTRHDARPSTNDEALLVDIDVAILGSDEDTYTAYTAAIRLEYQSLPRWYYNKQRAKVLGRFLERPTIYWTPTFRANLEAQARTNIAQEVALLNSSGAPGADPH